MKKWLLYLAFPLALAGCQSGPTEADKQQSLETEVMDLHDEAMVDMSKIYRLRRNLTTLRDTLTAQAADTAVTALLSRRIAELNDADEAMMDWMRNYKAPTEQPHQEAVLYLQEEHVKMARVKSLMDSTISNAKETYAQYGPQ
jgi:hypothetical protein